MSRTIAFGPKRRGRPAPWVTAGPAQLLQPLARPWRTATHHSRPYDAPVHNAPQLPMQRRDTYLLKPVLFWDSRLHVGGSRAAALAAPEDRIYVWVWPGLLVICDAAALVVCFESKRLSALGGVR